MAQVGSITVRIGADMSAITDLVEELTLLALAGKLAPEVGERILGLFEARAELFAFENDVPAAGSTDHVLVRPQPSEGLLVLMAAIRAGDGNRDAVEQALRHLESSIGSSALPMVEGGAGAVH